MAEQTPIEWCDSTFNGWIGCTKVSPGCLHCYAERLGYRFRVDWGAGKPRKRTSASYWKEPLTWDRQHELFFAEHGRRRRVFTNSLADVFDNEVDPRWRADLFELIRSTPNLDWLVLTKRIGLAAAMLKAFYGTQKLPTNFWIGASVVNQEEADRDIPKLLSVPATVRFLSCEPLLGHIDLSKWLATGGISWVIVGGESGPNARPMHPDWVRSIRDQCVAFGVPFLFKQWGEHSYEYDRDRDDPDFTQCSDWKSRPGQWINIDGGHGFHGKRVHYAHRVGKKKAGRILDGREWTQFPCS